VGQRRGLGLTVDTHRRRFVVDLDADTRTVVVGPRDALACRWIDLADPSWAVTGPPRAGDRVRVQIRAHAPAVLATLRDARDGAASDAAGTHLRAELDQPLHGVALGQAAVLYDLADDTCLGGGRIAHADRPAGLPLARAGAS
jgi:tRNA-specific 2-thiouridylase